MLNWNIKNMYILEEESIFIERNYIVLHIWRARVQEKYVLTPEHNDDDAV